jgi:hypothetical protein
MALFDSSDTRISPPLVGHATLGRLRPAELFDAWLFAETDATLALAAWCSAGSDEKPDAHAAYVAALDREAHAAAVLESRLSAAQ